MLRDRKIAVFIDVDNALLEYQHYDNVMQQLRSMGEIVCGTVYGASERKHKKVITDAVNNGFAIQLPSRTRRRVRKVFDNRIFVDVTDLVSHNSNVDAVAVVSHPDDMVYLFSYLRRLGIQVISTEDLDEQSLALVSQTLDLGKVEKIKLPKKTAPKKSAQPKPVVKEEPTAAEPKKEQPKVSKREQAQEDRTAELLREIAMLKNSYDDTPSKSVSQAEEQAQSRVEEVLQQPQEEPQPDIVNETQSLMEKIAALKEESPKEQSAPKAGKSKDIEPPKEQPVAESQPQQEQPKVVQSQEPAVQEQPAYEAPRATYVTQNDSDLIRRIEELRKNNAENDSDDLIAEIKKLLDGLE